MENLKRPFPHSKGYAGAMALLIALAAGLIALLPVGCSFSRPSQRAPEPPIRFEITVEEVRDESVYRAGADSLVMVRSKSVLGHFGRVEHVERVGDLARAGRSQEENEASYAVFNDSLVFRSETPFRYRALMRRDTLAVTAMDKGPSTSGAAFDADRRMLTCIFEGPALMVNAGAKGGPAEIVDLKKQCAGGLYRRLDLAGTLGMFVFRVPQGRDTPGSRWETVAVHPRFSPLGLSPDLLMSCRLVEPARESDGAPRIEVSCDTTLANLRSVTPAGDTIDIISHRIRIRGVVRPWPGLVLFHAGELSIEEDTRYVRPDLESPVLEKHTRVRIRFAPL